MTKRDAAPTIGWVIISHFYKWLAWLFLIIIFLAGTQIFIIYKQLNADCSDSFKRDVTIVSYSLHVEVGCVQNGR